MITGATRHRVPDDDTCVKILEECGYLREERRSADENRTTPAEMNDECLRRLTKLEATFTDRTGLVRYSKAWWEYWMKECGEAMEDRKPRNLIPWKCFAHGCRLSRIRIANMTMKY